jgi:hypothetical protein
MDLVKPHVDIGLFTNSRDAQLRFWRDEIGFAGSRFPSAPR